MATSNRQLTDTEYLVLQGLAAKPLHGYALKKAVEELASGEIEISLATMYDTLHRLLDTKLVQRLADEEREGRLLRTYEVTALGEAAVAAKRILLRRMLNIRATGTGRIAT